MKTREKSAMSWQDACDNKLALNAYSENSQEAFCRTTLQLATREYLWIQVANWLLLTKDRTRIELRQQTIIILIEVKKNLTEYDT